LNANVNYSSQKCQHSPKNIATIEFRRENENSHESILENIMNIKETPTNESKKKLKKKRKRKKKKERM